MAYKYFLYSDEQLKEKNSIMEKAGKIFEPGVVVVNGTRRRFTQLSDKPSLARFIDTKVIAEGEVNEFVYSMPKNVKRRA